MSPWHLRIVSCAAVVLAACVPLASLPAPATGAPAAQRQVVLVIVDGLRPEAIAAANAPNLQKLAATGAVSLRARAVEIPETLAGFVTIATGLPPSRHGITWDDDRGITLGLPTIYTRVAEAGRTSALYFGKSKLGMLAGGAAAAAHGPGAKNKNWEAGASDALARDFAREFTRQPFAFALVHLRETDFAGHGAGWMSPAYLDAVRRDDAALGVVLEAIASSPAAATTTVLLTADHGGEGTNHVARGTEASWTIPWLCWGPGIRPQAIAGTPTLLDVAPTALALLKLPPLPEMTGRPVKECAVP